MNNQPCVYIMTNKRYGTLYVGVTSNILHRAWEHRTGQFEGFTKDHDLKRLVYFEFLATFPEAIKREKTLKTWRRTWKIELIQSMNPRWGDLFSMLCE